MLEQFRSSPSLWRQILKKNFTKISVLADFLELNELQRSCLLSKAKFPLNLPVRLAEKIVKRTFEDPIFKQFVPLDKETIATPLFLLDPVSDVCFQKSDKLLHKYRGRVLLVTTGACAMHCRYCFRQNFDYVAGDKLFEKELELIQEDKTINEVILSGGDPLSLDNEVLKRLIESLSIIQHIKKIRFHTRFPIGIPERIDDGFLKILESSKKQIWFIIHSNHPIELDSDVLKVLKSIQKLGIPVLNQSVLLKGVNDSTEVMSELCSKLVDHGFVPYYVHQLDRVEGSAHFEVDEKIGKKIMEDLSPMLGGYAVPRYVKEVAGMSGKIGI